MHPFFEEFAGLLEKEDKEKCVEFAVSKLSSGQLDVLTLYNEILTPSLNRIVCRPAEADIKVWREHVKSAIVRTIVECCYPHVIRERDRKYAGKRRERVIVVCPADEYHEIGPRMVADFFTLLGYEAMFIGANTPQMNVVSAVAETKPKFVAMSVTNYYNLVAAQKTISMIRESGASGFKMIVGGNAFRRNPDEYRRIGADMLLQTFEEIRKLTAGGV